MNRRNAALLAAVLALLITCAMEFLPFLRRADITGIFYVPAIALSFILMGGGHSPTPVAGWTAFIVYTLLYLAVFIVIYVFVLEWYLLTRTLAGSQADRLSGAKEVSSESASLSDVGWAMQRIESRRRGHFLLKADESIDMKEDPAVTAARALTSAEPRKSVARVIGRLAKGKVKGILAKPESGLLARLRKEAADMKLGPTDNLAS
jgi:hypothetical protein